MVLKSYKLDEQLEAKLLVLELTFARSSENDRTELEASVSTHGPLTRDVSINYTLIAKRR